MDDICLLTVMLNVYYNLKLNFLLYCFSLERRKCQYSHCSDTLFMSVHCLCWYEGRSICLELTIPDTQLWK